MSLLEKRWFKIMTAIIMLLVIIFLLNQNQFILTPLVVLLKTIFIPLVVTGIFFYLCRPLVQWLEDKKIPAGFAILIVYLVVALIIYGLFKLVGPIINNQLEKFIDNFPSMVSTISDGIEYIRNHKNIVPSYIQDALINFSETVESQLEQNIGNIADSILGIFGFIGSTIFMLLLVPFILFYVLKDRKKFAPSITKFFPSSNRDQALKLLKEMDTTITSYIQGQALVSLCVGVLLLIGYLIIGLNYPLILAIFGMLTNVIPFLGPFIAVVPAFVVALFQEPVMALYVVIVMLIAQQIEGNLISPQVMGKTLDIHPLTIIVLILTAGNLVGILGVIFAIPTYAISKVIIVHFIKLYRLNKQ